MASNLRGEQNKSHCQNRTLFCASSDVLYTTVGSNVKGVVKKFRHFYFRFSRWEVEVGLCVCVASNEVCSQDIVYNL